MLVLQLAATIFLWGFASAASIKERRPRESTNAQRMARGLSVNHPARFFNATKTTAPPSKRSAAADPAVSQIVFGTSDPASITRRRASQGYAHVVDSTLAYTDDINLAHNFHMPAPEGDELAPLSWQAPAGMDGFTEGEFYTMYAAPVNGVYQLQFGTPPAGATTNMFASPSFAGGFRPMFTPPGRPSSQEYIWAEDGNGHMHLAPDVATALAVLEDAIILLAESFAVGATPSLAEAQNAATNQLVNPALLYATTAAGDIAGYLQISDEQFMIASTSDQATTFYVPGLSGNAASVSLLAVVDDVTMTVIVDDLSSTAATLSVMSGTTNAATFVVPANESGIISLTHNSASWIFASSTGTNSFYTCDNIVDCVGYRSGAQELCVEILLEGTSPGACAAQFAATTPPTTVTPRAPTEDGVGYLGCTRGPTENAVEITTSNPYLTSLQCEDECANDGYYYSFWTKNSYQCFCGDTAPTADIVFDSSYQDQFFSVNSLITPFKWSSCTSNFDNSSLTLASYVTGPTPDICFDACTNHVDLMMYPLVDTDANIVEWQCYCYDTDTSSLTSDPSSCQTNEWFHYSQDST